MSGDGPAQQAMAIHSRCPPMPRLPRLASAGIPMHVIQRGNNRLPCFFDDADRIQYRKIVLELLPEFGVELHAYVLMTNHVHLLATAGEAGAMSRFMQSLGRRYVGYINARHRRTGTLWEGRFKSCLVDSESHLLRCYRYVELNPVRAAIVGTPDEYRWSSYQCNGFGRGDPIVCPHDSYLRFGAEAASRQAAYRVFVAQAVSEEELKEIRAYICQERALGRPRFQAEIAAAHGRQASVRPRGRQPRSDRV